MGEIQQVGVRDELLVVQDGEDAELHSRELSTSEHSGVFNLESHSSRLKKVVLQYFYNSIKQYNKQIYLIWALKVQTTKNGS
jgi:hypothetical protein